MGDAQGSAGMTFWARKVAFGSGIPSCALARGIGRDYWCVVGPAVSGSEDIEQVASTSHAWIMRGRTIRLFS